MASRTDARLLKTTKFPPEFSQKVDMRKVNLQVMKKWIANRMSEILGNDDDVVIELCFNLIEGSRFPDIKALQIQLTGFLDKDTAGFCKELWKLLLSAQDSPQGVPKELLEAKKLELIQEKMEADRAANDDRRREDPTRRDRGTGDPRSRDRHPGGRDRPNDWNNRRPDFNSNHSFDGRGGGGYVRGNRRSRSPGDRQDSRSRPSDSYMSRGRAGQASTQTQGDSRRSRRHSKSPGSTRHRSSSRGSRDRSRTPDNHSKHRSSNYRKRSRSRSGSRRGEHRSGRRSRSVSSTRASKSTKRRRYSPSPSRSRDSRRRSSSASSRSYSSRSYSRPRSRSRSRTRDSRSRSRSRSRDIGGKDRRRRNSSSVSPERS
ncbi:Putative Serine/arginine repetitive matrix protein 1 [[Torrubiella] hemipterigena]|uniref:Putative Serine/arginine repetitive matrix protein 1 n=1 Tax=[Torrubiella] hemipterigena TaxID=1531966 RepID=A0A0A1TJB4_9HYPO|nr:Putative Serine/arginine repetitive matrix protein 1 [[Torrubiella] hemipterigena]